MKHYFLSLLFIPLNCEIKDCNIKSDCKAIKTTAKNSYSCSCFKLLKI